MLEWIPLEWWSFLPLAVGISFKSSSGSTQSSGGSRVGTQEGDALKLSNYLSGQFSGPLGQYTSDLLSQPFQMPQLNGMGIYETQQQGFDTALGNATGQASSNLARRGFLNANASPLAASMGVQTVAPQFLQAVGANVEQQATMPEYVRQQRVNQVQNFLKTLIAAMGGQSYSNSSGGSESQSGGLFS